MGGMATPFSRKAGEGLRLADADHPEGEKLALLLAHRHILADLEGMVAEAEAFLLLFVLGSPLPFEGPGRAAAPPRVMNEEAAHRRLVAPEAMSKTFAAMLLPGFEVDVAVGGQGSDEVIAVPDRPVGEFLRTRGVQRHLAQRGMTWRGHRPSSFSVGSSCEPLSPLTPISDRAGKIASRPPQAGARVRRVRAPAPRPGRRRRTSWRGRSGRRVA